MRLFNTAPVYPSALNDTLLLSEPLPHSARSYRDHVETLRASITHRLCSAWNDQGMAQVEVPFHQMLIWSENHLQNANFDTSCFRLQTEHTTTVGFFNKVSFPLQIWCHVYLEGTEGGAHADVWWAPSKLQFQVDAFRHVGLDLVQGSLASNRPDRHEAVEGPRRRRRWNASLLFKFTG